jgi:hypothetical protein
MFSVATNKLPNCCATFHMDQLLCDDYSRLRKGNLLTVLDGPDEKHPVLEVRSDGDADKGLHQKIIV